MKLRVSKTPESKRLSELCLVNICWECYLKNVDKDFVVRISELSSRSNKYFEFCFVSFWIVSQVFKMCRTCLYCHDKLFKLQITTFIGRLGLEKAGLRVIFASAILIKTFILVFFQYSFNHKVQIMNNHWIPLILSSELHV